MYKLKSLQAARGLAALAVVAFHSMFIHEKYIQSPGFFSELFVFGQTGVDLFFVISGFVMILASKGKFGDRKSIPGFLKGRFLRIYPTYWVYFLALFIVLQIKPEILNSSQGGNTDLWASFWLLPSSVLPLLMVAWSLVHEVWFYLVFAGILCLPSRMTLGAFTLWLVAVVLASIALSTPSNPYLRVITHAFSIEFILGAMAAMAYLRILKSGMGNKILLVILTAGLGTVLYALKMGVVDGSDVISSISLDRAFAVGGGYALILLSCVLIEVRVGIKGLTALKPLGDMSYSLYLSHILTLSLCGKLWTLLGNGANSILAVVFFWVFSYVAVISVAYLSYRLVEKPLLRSMAAHRSANHVMNPDA